MKLRLALVAVRGCAYQPQELGGDGFMARFFDSQARDLMAVALSVSPALAGESPISLEAWFATGATRQGANDLAGRVAAPDAVPGHLPGQGPGQLTPSRWEAAKGRARQAQQHVNPLALQHGIEAVQGALTGSNLAKVDKNTGKLKVKKTGVAKAVLRPAKTARQAVEGTALAERLKAYNDSVRTLPVAASAAEFASYPSKADYLRDWARQLIVAAGITPDRADDRRVCRRAANGIIHAVFGPMGIGTGPVEPGGPTAAGLPLVTSEGFERMYRAAAENDSGPQLTDEQVVAFLNERRTEWMTSIRGTRP